MAYRPDGIAFAIGILMRFAAVSGRPTNNQFLYYRLDSGLIFDGRDDYRPLNLWRRWFIDCNLRKINGAAMQPQLASLTSFMYYEMKNATDDNQIAAFDAYRNHGVKLDYWWMDAG